MDNKLEMFRFSIANVSKTYVTKAALGYFRSIKGDIDKIARDIYRAETGQEVAFTPYTFEIDMEIYHIIEEYEKCMEQCSKNDPKEAENVMELKGALIKFEHIKALMQHGDEALREDGMILFTKAADVYTDQEQEEFVNMLNEEELGYIMQMVYQERTLLDKMVTNSTTHRLVEERMKRK